MRTITRQQMLDAAQKKAAGYEKWYEKMSKQEGRNSFAARGAYQQMRAAQALVTRLERGGTPTTHEVVAYFGAGARFQTA